MGPLPSEDDLLKQLRSEATDVKQCFTTFSFQALALSLSILAATFGALGKAPEVVYAPLPVVTLLMAVCRLGTFKYGTANRNYGYELHLARTRRVANWSPEMRTIGWEEGLRAWRVVQPTLFRQIYRSPSSGAFSVALNALRPGLYALSEKARAVVNEAPTRSASDDNYPWFMPALLAKLASGRQPAAPEAVYHAGSYLDAMFGLLVLTQGLLLLPLAVVTLAGSSPNQFIDPYILLGMSSLILLRAVRIHRRLELLENEFLSIHSCAIVWQAVVLVHHLAIRASGDSHQHYTEHLAEYAQQAAAHVSSIHRWMAMQQPNNEMHLTAGHADGPAPAR